MSHVNVPGNTVLAAPWHVMLDMRALPSRAEEYQRVLCSAILVPEPHTVMGRRQSTVLGGNLLLSKDGKQWTNLLSLGHLLPHPFPSSHRPCLQVLSGSQEATGAPRVHAKNLEAIFKTSLQVGLTIS